VEPGEAALRIQMEIIIVMGNKMLFNEAKYDKRLIEIGQIPSDYGDYLKSLKCCVCGSREPCICTKEDFESLSKRKNK